MSRLDSIDKFKGLEGSTIYAIPTGNEARGGMVSQLNLR